MINLLDLSIEVTQRCNMSCKHCVRGKSRYVDININAVKNALSDVCYVHALTLTGGEPSLNIKGVYQILSIFKELDIPLGYFYIVTNGKKFSPALIRTLDKYIDYCYHPRYCGFVISDSQFHENVSNNIDEYIKLARSYIKWRPTHYIEGEIIRMGNAEKNGLGSKSIMVGEGFVFRYSKKDDGLDFITDKNEIQIDSTIYISGTGEVLDTCALSYDKMNRHSFGNVLNKRLKTILIQNEYKAPDNLKTMKVNSW